MSKELGPPPDEWPTPTEPALVAYEVMMYGSINAADLSPAQLQAWLAWAEESPECCRLEKIEFPDREG